MLPAPSAEVRDEAPATVAEGALGRERDLRGQRRAGLVLLERVVRLREGRHGLEQLDQLLQLHHSDAEKQMCEELVFRDFPKQ